MTWGIYDGDELLATGIPTKKAAEEQIERIREQLRSSRRQQLRRVSYDATRLKVKRDKSD